MVDEHTRESLLHLAEAPSPPSGSSPSSKRTSHGRRTADRVTDGQRSLAGFSSAATVLREQGDLSYIPPGTPLNNGYIESFINNAYATSASTATTGTLCSGSAVIGDFKQERNHRHRHSAVG
jgi:hypothetical protein